MLQDIVTSRRAERNRENAPRDFVPAREEHSTGSFQINLGLLLVWTSKKFCRDCAGLTDAEHSEAMAVDGKNLLVYNRNHFERDIALGAGNDDGRSYANGVRRYL